MLQAFKEILLLLKTLQHCSYDSNSISKFIQYFGVVLDVITGWVGQISMILRKI